MNSLKLFGRLAPAAALLAVAVSAQTLPEGPGREETIKLCSSCHEVARSVSLRQDKDGWQGTLRKMTAMGTKGTDEEFAKVLEYLAKNFPAGELAPVNMNKANAVEMESRLGLRRSQAAAIITYREKQGQFKSINDLKAIPVLDFAKLLAKKDRMVF